MTLLCIAVQNSQTMLGVYDGVTLAAHWRVSTETTRTADEWAHLVGSLLTRAGWPDLEGLDGIAICSAVPAVLHELRAACASYASKAEVVIVGAGVKSGLPVLTDNPREVGTDRIANAIAALAVVGAPCIVVDVGTATTFDVVNADGAFVGGAIAPGIAISLEALGLRGAQLRQVELVAPRSVIAKNTVEALQSGVVYGAAGQIDGIVGRIIESLGLDDVPVVVTGEHSELVLGECASITRHEPWLTMAGLRLIFERNV